MKRIVTLPGDGIGPEITASALKVLEAASQHVDFKFEVEEHIIGGAAIDQDGHPFPDATKKACQAADAILLGAVGGPKWEQAERTPEAGLLEMRQTLELFANLRPVEMHDYLLKDSPLKEEIVKGTDFVMVRELTGGIYFGRPKYFDEEEAVDTLHYNRGEIERIVRLAFDLAKTRKNKVTLVDKANVLASSQLWRKVATQIAQEEYPEVEFEWMYVDNAAMQIITNPTAYDVIVTENMFGDILSDEASVITGSLGMLPSASLSQTNASLYEPIHGSAPDIAGKDIANPMSMILSVTMMLRQSFEEFEMADRIEHACAAVMDRGMRTADLGGDTSNSTFTQAVIDEINKGASS